MCGRSKRFKYKKKHVRFNLPGVLTSGKYELLICICKNGTYNNKKSSLIKNEQKCWRYFLNIYITYLYIMHLYIILSLSFIYYLYIIYLIHYTYIILYIIYTLYIFIVLL